MASFGDVISARYSGVCAGDRTAQWRQLLYVAVQLYNDFVSRVPPPSCSPRERDLLAILDGIAGRFSSNPYNFQRCVADLEDLRTAIVAAIPDGIPHGAYDPSSIGTVTIGPGDTVSYDYLPTNRGSFNCLDESYPKFRVACWQFYGVETATANLISIQSFSITDAIP
jgi:hypothetical protein